VIEDKWQNSEALLVREGRRSDGDHHCSHWPGMGQLGTETVERQVWCVALVRTAQKIISPCSRTEDPASHTWGPR
jgi:hypothetical protein